MKYANLDYLNGVCAQQWQIMSHVELGYIPYGGIHSWQYFVWNICMCYNAALLT